jgi:hypothetical protein
MWKKCRFLALDSSKRDDKSALGNGKGPLCKIAIVRKILL